MESGTASAAAPPRKTLFISRAGADAEVAAEVGHVLEAAGYGVILQQWDFGNRHFMERMHEALASGAHVVALLSPEYLRSDHCQAEWMNAIADDPLNRNGRLILLRVADCVPSGLLAGIATWDLIGARNDAELFADIVCRAVGSEPSDNAAGAPRSLAVPKNRTNLPQEVKALIGREHDIAEIRELLGRARIVTLAGVGGVGKTSCALKAGSASIADYPDGVWFADLAAIADGAQVAAQVAAVFGIVESAKSPVLDALTAHLRGARTLIILDNCEHVIDACSRCAAAVLRACAGVSLLATSREALKVEGEYVYGLSTLGVPERDAPVGISDAAGYGAVALFAARARAADSRFELTPQNVASVAEICRRLDGIPLAIELAAARVRVLTPHGLEQKLDERFRLLTSGARSALPRQQTMRALIDWSYDLLDVREQALFRALSIFSGSFSLDSAVAVCAGDEVDEFEVVDDLTSLIEKSLVVSESAGQESRYRLLESVREYGRERLNASGRRDETARRHAVAFAELAERLEEAYGTTSYRAWVAGAEREIENLRAALTWSFGPTGDAAIGLRVAGMLRRIFNTSFPAEARRWVQAALGRVDAETPRPLVARLELADAHLASRLNQFNPALAAARRALALFESAGDERGVAAAQRLAGRSLIVLGDVAGGEQLLHAALDSHVKRGLHSVGPVLLDLGTARAASGDLPAARSFFARALEQFERDQDDGNIALTAGTLAEAEFHGGDREAAVRHAQAALAAAEELPRYITLWLQSNLAAFLIGLDRFERARPLITAALSTAVRQQSEFWIAVLVQHVAAVLALDPQSSTSEAVELSARLSGYVDKKLRDLDSTREFTEQQEYDRIVHALTNALQPDRLRSLCDDGAKFTDERAADLAAAASAPRTQHALV